MRRFTFPRIPHYTSSLTEPGRRIDARLAPIAAGVLALILYGSLYPFHFHSSLPFSSLVSLLLATVNEPLDRGDLISNILLYLPFGFFTALTFRRASPAARVIVVTLAASMLALSLEFTQYYDYSRSPSLADAFGNTLGTLAGAIAAVSLRRDPSFPMLLLLAWTGDRLLPFVPSFYIHKYAAALKPLFLAPRLHPLEVYSHFALWLAAAALLEALAGIERSRRMIALLLAFVLAARVVLDGAVLSASEVTGGILAALAWITVSPRLPKRTALLAVIFTAFVILEALRPFHFLPTPRAFTWAPFVGFMAGPRESGSRVFLEKTYIYGSLLWLLARVGLSYAATAISAATLVLCLRLIQVYLAGRSAESGDAVMVLILAGVMTLLPPPAHPPPYPPSPAETVPR